MILSLVNSEGIVKRNSLGHNCYGFSYASRKSNTLSCLRWL